MNTATQSLVPGGPPPPEAPRRHWRWWYAVPPAFVVLSVVLASVVVIPYYAILPGSALPVGALVEVPADVSHDAEGEIYLTTVKIQPATLLSALQGWLDPDVQVVERAVILPPTVEPDELRRFNRELMDTSQQAALGVAFEQLGYDAISGRGAQVVDVLPSTPAAGNLFPGDTVVAVGDRAVTVDYELVRALAGRQVGDPVTLTVEDEDGGQRMVELVLGAHPDDPDRPFLGVTLQTRDLSFDFPVEVQIGTEGIGGPSAGLAFALQVIDLLTEGELTGGRRVAVTGTIELDGSVGPIGGVAQKAVTVADSGIDLFLVPARELRQARAAAGGRVRVEPVETLQDALRILAAVGGNGLALERIGPDEPAA